METSTSFSKTELALTVTNCVIAKLFLVYPSSFAASSASAGILAAAATAAVGGGVILLTSYLYEKKRTDISRIFKSKAFTAAVLALISIFFAFNQALFVRTVSEGLKVSILPDSPVNFITFIFVAAALLCSHTGLKAVIRTHSFVVPFTLAMLLILTASSVKNFDIFNIFPIFGKGIESFSSVWISVSYFSDFIMLLLLMPFASKKTSYSKIAKPAFFTSAAVLIAVIGLYTLTVPYTLSDSYFIPIYKVAQYINYESFMSRLESVFTVGWLLSFIMYSSLQIYIMSMLTGRITGAKSCRKYMYFYAVLIAVLSALPENTAVLADGGGIFSAIRTVIGICLPIVLLLFPGRTEVKKK